MTRHSGAAIAVLGLVLSACGGAAQTDGAANDAVLVEDTPAQASLERRSSRVVGTVKDARLDKNLAGVTVSDGRRMTTTGADGSYRLYESAGTVTLTAQRSGYVTATQRVTVPRSGSTTVNWRLVPSSGPTSACTYSYSGWDACQANGTQARTVLSSSPSGCTGTPSLSQACSFAPPPPAPNGTAFKVFANNDLGMHCVDSSFAVFSILPPFNVVNAQVVALQSSGKPVLLDASQVDVRYSAIADATGSVNSTSPGKSDFWQYERQLYGLGLAQGEGLLGMWMPADAPNVAGRTLGWDAGLGLFHAPGIPIFPIDDAGRVNRYPLMRFSALDKAGKNLGSTDVVLPVSEETSCQTCHATGRSAAPAGAMAWSNDPDLEAQARRNVLTLHNARNGTNLSPPVLCASCHYSPALDLAGSGPSAEQSRHRTMSSVMHRYHATKMAGFADAPVPPGGEVPAPSTQSCYQCHPGTSTQCLRGAMTTSLDCQNCHGNMAAVGGALPLLAGGSIDGQNDHAARRPWQDLPRCQSCHASDAVKKTAIPGTPPLAADGLRFVYAFANGDASASPIVAANDRFAQQPNKLFRQSKGHGGLACEACHGSTHAIWAAGGNDDVAAKALQGHAGTIGECSTCHQAPPSNGLGGPHGMHPVGASWVSAHKSFGEKNLGSCTPCHGTDYRGTALSKMFATRTLAGRTLTAGTQVGCYTCHNGPHP